MEEEAIRRRNSEPLRPRVMRWPAREGSSEALTGARAGWAIEPRKCVHFRAPTPFACVEGHTHTVVIYRETMWSPAPFSDYNRSRSGAEGVEGALAVMSVLMGTTVVMPVVMIERGSLRVVVLIELEVSLLVSVLVLVAVLVPVDVSVAASIPASRTVTASLVTCCGNAIGWPRDLLSVQDLHPVMWLASVAVHYEIYRQALAQSLVGNRFLLKHDTRTAIVVGGIVDFPEREPGLFQQVLGLGQGFPHHSGHGHGLSALRHFQLQSHASPHLGILGHALRDDLADREGRMNLLDHTADGQVRILQVHAGLTHKLANHTRHLDQNG